MVHRFGSFELDDERFELRRGGAMVPIPRRAFDLLLYLVRYPDVVVSKERLLTNVWPDVTVAKDALPHAMMVVRTALGEDIEHPVFIHTVRGRGYRFVSAIFESRAAAQNPPSVGLSSRPLVGRGALIDTLRARLARARDGVGGGVLVTGAPGVGKTRLLDELARDPAGGRVVSVRCASRTGAPKLWPIAEALRELEVGGTALTPELSALARGSIDEVTLELPERRFRLFDRIVRTFVAEAAVAPVLLLIDDLDRADDRSLDFFELLIARVAATRTLVVATHRPAHAGAPRFGAAFGALSSLPSTLVATLEPFTREGVAEYLAQMLPRPPSVSVLERVYTKTLGNPLLVSQLVHVLGADEGLRVDPMSTSTLVENENMREAIVHRLAELPPPVLKALTMAAVFGQTVPLAPLATALASTNADVLRELDVAASARILGPSSADVHRFTYPLVRDVLYKRLPAAERAHLHGRAAAALEEHAGDVLDHTVAGTIAHHLVEAATTGDVGRAVDWSLRASALARESGDDAAGATYAARGLEALRYAPRADPERHALLLAASRRSK